MPKETRSAVAAASAEVVEDRKASANRVTEILQKLIEIIDDSTADEFSRAMKAAGQLYPDLNRASSIVAPGAAAMPSMPAPRMPATRT